MPKINREEYEVLKELDDKWKWIARDGECNSLNVYSVKPIKVHSQWDYMDVGYKHAGLTKEENKMFQFIQWEDEEPYNIAELIEEYESEAEVKNLEWLKEEIGNMPYTRLKRVGMEGYVAINKSGVFELINQLDEPEPKNITLQDVTDKLWELPLNNRKLWLARLNDEFQEGYIVPLGLKTTDGEEQYLTYNGSYFASRRNKYLQQTFDKLEEIPEFYRGLAERVL